MTKIHLRTQDFGGINLILADSLCIERRLRGGERPVATSLDEHLVTCVG
jgi:hypothetical protein